MKKLLLFSMAIVIMSACQQPVETHTVSEKPLNEAVYASGEIMPLEYFFMCSKTPERILRSMVQAGDTVKQGDILVTLGTRSENRQLDILTRQVLLAKENMSENSSQLKELEGRIALARQRYQQDSVNAVRYQNLAREGALPKRDAELAVMQAEASLTDYKNLRLQLRTQRNQLSERLLQAEQQLASLKHTQEDKILASPVNGIVYNINMEAGELVQPHEPVLMVGLADKFKLELLVDERDINKISIGQKVYFETDAYPEQQFEARLKKIVSVLDKETRSFKVEAEVLAKERFYPMSSVEANIEVREADKALVIPSDYLLAGDSVKVQQGDGTQKVKVTTGVADQRWIEVRKGLKKGDVIVK